MHPCRSSRTERARTQAVSDLFVCDYSVFAAGAFVFLRIGIDMGYSRLPKDRGLIALSKFHFSGPVFGGRIKRALTLALAARGITLACARLPQDF